MNKGYDNGYGESAQPQYSILYLLSLCIYIGHLNITDIDFFLWEQYNISFPLRSYIFVSEYYTNP